MKNFKEKLNPGEQLRIKKIGRQFFAYARWAEYGCQKEKYFGRCDSEGNKTHGNLKIRRRIKPKSRKII